MRKINLLLVTALVFCGSQSLGQISRGNVMVGGDLANFNLTLGGGGAFQASVSPKAAFFIRDNVALGAYLDFGLATAKGAGTTTNYGVGALGRNYISDPTVNVLRQGRFFLEGTAGIEGVSIANGSNTTGLGIGAGPGYAYFITPNIGLEALVKYNGIVGFGSQAYRSNVGLGVGFQIYLGRNKAKEIVNDVN